ncbi:thymidylate synthase (FAD) [Candidatus Poribacteria bacterium]|nr:thymidylate synthase (FAD) [Candidatus Poribacteria bacterium]|tara:strand:- start:179 stop:802 length:624 start_codon:yes stop_codon:yes gene_type:complete
MVKLLDSMGDDLTVVNAARVSFGKKKKNFTDGDARLIKYLARHNHWTPFGHVSLQFHIKAPIFVARQLVKHQVGLVWNEISRRYVDTEPEYHMPEGWRARVKDKKQGSDPDLEVVNMFTSEYPHFLKVATNLYNKMLDSDVCPEQARMVLPQSLMTEWYWSGTLMAFARVCNLRSKPDAQYETRVISDEIDSLASAVAPVSWEELRG